MRFPHKWQLWKDSRFLQHAEIIVVNEQLETFWYLNTLSQLHLIIAVYLHRIWDLVIFNIPCQAVNPGNVYFRI